MTEGLDAYRLPKKWTNPDNGSSVWLEEPSGPWYQLSGEALEQLLEAAGYESEWDT